MAGDAPQKFTFLPTKAWRCTCCGDLFEHHPDEAEFCTNKECPYEHFTMGIIRATKDGEGE